MSCAVHHGAFLYGFEICGDITGSQVRQYPGHQNARFIGVFYQIIKELIDAEKRITNIEQLAVASIYLPVMATIELQRFAA